MNKTIKVKEFKDIVDYFNDIHCTDVSNVDITIGNMEDGKLGSCKLYTNEILISNKIRGSLLECTIVHELTHYLQKKNKSICINIKDDRRYYSIDNGLIQYEIYDLMLDEFDDDEYWDRKTEIDARINEVCYAFYITWDIEIVKAMYGDVFTGGLTDNLYSCISNLSIMPEVKDVMLEEYNRRFDKQKEKKKAWNDEFLLALDELSELLEL